MAASARKSAQTARYAEKQAELVEVATRLMFDRGLRGFTMADVAERAGMIPQAVVYYFARKDDLCAACIASAVERLHAIARQARAAPTAPERVAAFFRAYFAERALIATGEAPQMAPLHELRALGRLAFEGVGQKVQRLVGALMALLDAPGAAALDETAQLARGHFLLQCALSAPGWEASATPADYARTAERLIDILLGGLAPAGARWDPPALPPLHSAETPPREAFLRAASELINEQGYHGASVTRISQRLQRTKGAFYHHNEAKDDVVTRCFQRTIALFGQAQLQAATAPLDGLRRLEGAARSLVDFQLSPAGPLVRTGAIYALPPEDWPQVHPQWRRMIQRFAGMVSDGVAEGVVRPVDPIVAGELVMVAINSSGEFRTSWKPELAPQSIGALYVRPLFEGILSP